MMVMENPMQFTMVNEVPRDSSGTFCATNVENNGESATTTNPQKKRKASNTGTEPVNKRTGESRQHKQDKPNAIAAIFLAPYC